MARTPQGLASGTLILGSNLIYTTPDSTNVIITSLILTNLELVIGECEIYLNREAARLLGIVSIPSGNGKAVRVNLLQGTSLNATDTLSITADKTNINFDLSGYVVT